jgi:hypothetical protein
MAEDNNVDTTISGALKGALGSEISGPLADIYQKERENARKIAESKYQQQLGEARGAQAAQEKFATGERARYEQAKPELMAPAPKFNITQDTQQGLSGLAVLLPIAGMIIGSKGQMSGINAMNAMTGLMKGYQEGNQQRIAFEKQKYDAAMKEWDTHIKQVKDSLDKYTDLAKYDLQSATAKAKADAIAQGHGVIGDIIDQQGLVKARGIVEQIALEKEKNASKLTQASRAQQGANERLMIASRGAASAMEQISNMRAGTTAGILPYLSNKEGMLNYLKSASGRTLSSDDAQALHVLYTGVARNLAAVEAAGAASGLVGLTESFKALEPMKGDSNYIVAIKLADARRIVEESMKAVIGSGTVNPQQIQEIQSTISRFEKAVPFTVDEVNKAIREKGKKQETIQQQTQRLIQGPEASREQRVPDQQNVPSDISVSGW